MRAFWIALLSGWLLLTPTAPPLHAKDIAGPITSWSELPATLRQILAATRAPGSSWGMLVVHADSGAVWFATNSTRLFVPASNTKLFTVALALDRFGPDHRFSTTLAFPVPPDSTGTSSGPLWIRAGGAPFSSPRPSLGDPSASLTVPSISSSPLAPILDLLGKHGVRRITGGLYLDDRWFDAPPFGAGWNWDDLQEAYGAPVNAFVWNDNSAAVIVTGGTSPGSPATVNIEPALPLFLIEPQVTTVATNQPAHLTYRRLPGESKLRITGTVHVRERVGERLSVPDAPRAFGLALQAALAQRGIQLEGGIRIAGPAAIPPAGSLGQTVSAPLQVLAAECLKPSNNLLAHLLLLQVGADVRHHPRPTDRSGGVDDAERGTAALMSFLRPLGITGNDVFIEEGSGLSQKNLVNPDATVRLLRHVKQEVWGPSFIAALPVGGVDGTLAGRFREGPAHGNVRAKTGSLRHVHALAGYVNTAAGQPLVFAIYVNAHQTEADLPSARTEIDRLGGALAGFTGRGPE